MKKTEPENNNQHLVIPPILSRIDKVRQMLAGTDRTDHLHELEVWEQRAKKDIILLSLQGHEGIDMIIKQAKETIALCQSKLRTERPSAITEKDAIRYTLEREFLFQQIDLYGWFLGMFQEAQVDIDAIEMELAQQEEEEAPTEY